LCGTEIGACQANQIGWGGLSFSRWILARITSMGTSASFLPCRTFQRSSFTCPSLGSSNRVVASDVPQVSGSLKAKRSPCLCGPPRVIALGFQLSNGHLIGPRDMFDDPGFDEARNLTNTIANHLRRHGPFEPHRLPMDEMEYTTMPLVMEKRKERWRELPD